MKVFVDECVDWRLSRDIVGHDGKTARQMGWSTIKNGELLARLRAEAGSSLAEAIDLTLADQDDMMAYRELVELLRARRWLAALRRLVASRGRRFFLVRRAAHGLANRIAESQLRPSIVNKLRAHPNGSDRP